MAKVWFGRSRENKGVIVVMEQKIVDTLEARDESGEHIFIPVFQPELESWINRTDMSFSMFSINPQIIPEAKKLYEDFVHAVEVDTPDKEESEKLKNKFIDFVKLNKLDEDGKWTKEQKEKILEKIESNRIAYELTEMYETHKPILCMFTDKPTVHVYNEGKDKESYLEGWAVNVSLANGEVISCIASHNSYGEDDIDDGDNFIVG